MFPYRRPGLARAEQACQLRVIGRRLLGSRELDLARLGFAYQEQGLVGPVLEYREAGLARFALAYRCRRPGCFGSGLGAPYPGHYQFGRR